MRKDVAFAVEQFRMSERRACKLVGVDRSSYRYEPRPDHNAELREVGDSGAAEAALRLPAIACAAEQAWHCGQRAARLPAVSKQKGWRFGD